MKLPALPSLKRDPKAALAKAQFELTAAEAKLSELAIARGQALVETDELEAVAAIDASINEQHRTISILTDRCTALASQVWQQDHERREAERTAAVSKLEAAFQKRVAIAAELEKSVQQTGSLWRQLLESREPCLEFWPEELFPRPPAAVLQSRQMERELSYLLFACAGTVFGVSRLPAPMSPPGVAGLSPKGLAGCVQEEHANILENLRNAPLPNEVEQGEAA